MSQCSGVTFSEGLSWGGRKRGVRSSSSCPSAGDTGASPWDGPSRDGSTGRWHLPCSQFPPVPRGSVQALRLLLSCTKTTGINCQLSTFTPLFLRQSVDNSSFFSNSRCFHVPCTLKSTCDNFKNMCYKQLPLPTGK